MPIKGTEEKNLLNSALNQMKSSVFVVAILTIFVLTAVTQVEGAVCGSLSSGKRINKCRKPKLKNKARALIKSIVTAMDGTREALLSTTNRETQGQP